MRLHLVEKNYLLPDDCAESIEKKIKVVAMSSYPALGSIYKHGVTSR